MWSPDVLRVGLAGDRLLLAPGGRVPRRGGDADGCRELGFGGPSTATDGPAWRQALSALAECLATAGRTRRVELVLGDHLVRWKLLELPGGLKAQAERDALAAHVFRDSLGDAAGHWRVQLIAQPGGWATPACAVDGRLLDELAAVCATAGVALGSVRPYFAAAFDYWRARLAGSAAQWFGVRSGDSLALGLLADGRWAGVQTRPASGPWTAQLASMQAQLAIPVGLDGASAALHLIDADGDAAEVGIAEPSAVVLRPPPHWHERAVRCRMAYGI